MRTGQLIFAFWAAAAHSGVLSTTSTHNAAIRQNITAATQIYAAGFYRCIRALAGPSMAGQWSPRAASPILTGMSPDHLVACAFEMPLRYLDANELCAVRDWVRADTVARQQPSCNEGPESLGHESHDADAGTGSRLGGVCGRPLVMICIQNTGYRGCDSAFAQIGRWRTIHSVPP